MGNFKHKFILATSAAMVAGLAVMAFPNLAHADPSAWPDPQTITAGTDTAGDTTISGSLAQGTGCQGNGHAVWVSDTWYSSTSTQADLPTGLPVATLDDVNGAWTYIVAYADTTLNNSTDTPFAAALEAGTDVTLYAYCVTNGDQSTGGVTAFYGPVTIPGFPQEPPSVPPTSEPPATPASISVPPSSSAPAVDVTTGGNVSGGLPAMMMAAGLLGIAGFSTIAWRKRQGVAGSHSA